MKILAMILASSKKYLDYETKNISNFLNQVNMEHNMIDLEKIINEAFDNKDSISLSTKVLLEML